MEEKNFMSWYRPDGVAIDFAVYEKKPGYSSSVPLHCHDYFEIEFVISGVMKNTVNGSKQRMERGDLFILSVADSHKIDIESGNCLIYKLNFRRTPSRPICAGCSRQRLSRLSSTITARNSTRCCLILKGSRALTPTPTMGLCQM